MFSSHRDTRVRFLFAQFEKTNEIDMSEGYIRYWDRFMSSMDAMAAKGLTPSESVVFCISDAQHKCNTAKKPTQNNTYMLAAEVSPYIDKKIQEISKEFKGKKHPHASTSHELDCLLELQECVRKYPGLWGDDRIGAQWWCKSLGV